MLLTFFDALRAAGVPVSPREHLTLLEALDRDLAERDAEGFYHLARACLVKDEGHLDRFDRAFAQAFRGVLPGEGVAPQALPEEWLRALAKRHLDPEELARLEALGWDELWETLRKRLAEQEGRHQGGSKWIGTGGTSPFGAYGTNPAGVRVGQAEGRAGRAVKVWDRREFKDLDGDRTLDTRNLRVALRRLRRFARDGAPEELDLDATVHGTARQGYLDVHLRPERRNRVKVLLLLDVGGSMDWHVEEAERLFSAARAEFRRLDAYYFHNLPYERVWRENRRREDSSVPTEDLLRTLTPDTRLVIVGDASMSPTEIALPGGSVEHWNAESGEAWLGRLLAKFPHAAWLNPVAQAHWGMTHSIAMLRDQLGGRMHPLTPEGVSAAAKSLAR